MGRVLLASTDNRNKQWQLVQQGTDQALAVILAKRDLLLPFFIDGAYSQTANDTVNHGVEKLRALRARPSEKDAQGLPVALAYSSVLGDWLVLLEELLGNSRIETNRPLGTYLLLVQIKEQEEKQRTLLSLAMAQNTVDSNDLRETLSTISSQDWMLKIFEVLAPKNMLRPVDPSIEGTKQNKPAAIPARTGNHRKHADGRSGKSG